jgi:O-antigen ligase
VPREPGFAVVCACVMFIAEGMMPIGTVKMIGNRPRREPLWRSKEAFFTDAGLFILGAAGMFSANIVGSLPGDEIILFPLLPLALLAQGKRAFDRRYLWFYLLIAGWLLGTLIADIYNGSPPVNRMKGTARVIFFAFDFIVLAVLLNGRARRLVIFTMSIVAVMLVGSWQFRGSFNVQWKFGVSEGLAMIAMLVSSYYYAKRRYWICFSISLVLAGLNLIYGFRSQLAIVFVAAVLILPIFGQARTIRGSSRSGYGTSKVVMLLVLAGGAAYMANVAIKYAARRGFFDESTQAKFETQSEGDYGVLVGGRPETLVAIQAIRDSPIIGHGSFPYGPQYRQLQQDIQYEHGYSDTDEPEEVEFEVIPTHSHLTLGWVESGILGGVFWIYVLVLTLRAIFRLSAMRPQLAPLYSYFLVSFLWDILYSPFGSVNRIWAAFYILLSYHVLNTCATDVQRARRRKMDLTQRGGRQTLQPASRTARQIGRSLTPWWLAR